jgi:hypothetical protein
MPHGQRLTLWLAGAGASDARVQWNGEDVAVATLAVGQWTPIVIDLPDIELYTNELTIKAVPADFAAPEGWPPAAAPVGSAVSNLEVEFLRP